VSLCPFSFLAIVLSVLIRFTASDCTFGDLRLLIAPLVIYGFWFHLWWFTASDFTFGDLRLLIAPLVIYGFWLHLWWFTASDFTFGDLRLLIAPLVIYGFWLHLWWFTASDCTFGDLRLLISPLVIYSFWLHLWYLQALPKYFAHSILLDINIKQLWYVFTSLLYTGLYKYRSYQYITLSNILCSISFSHFFHLKRFFT
jgi:hypothetical protein